MTLRCADCPHTWVVAANPLQRGPPSWLAWNHHVFVLIVARTRHVDSVCLEVILHLVYSNVYNISMCDVEKNMLYCVWCNRAQWWFYSRAYSCLPSCLVPAHFLILNSDWKVFFPGHWLLLWNIRSLWNCRQCPSLCLSLPAPVSTSCPSHTRHCKPCSR